MVGYVLGVLGLLGMDWFTKYLAQAHLGDKSIPIIGEFLQLRYVVNTGLSFSSFAGNEVVTTLVPVIGMVILVIMYIFLLKYLKKRNEEKAVKVINLGSVFLLAGFIGNYAERLVHGGVIDFISVKGFAVFNVADICLTVVEVLLIVVLCPIAWKYRKEKKAKNASEKQTQKMNKEE